MLVAEDFYSANRGETEVLDLRRPVLPVVVAREAGLDEPPRLGANPRLRQFHDCGEWHRDAKRSNESVREFCMRLTFWNPELSLIFDDG